MFREDVQELDKMILLLSTTGAMLTLDLVDLLILSIDKIIIYPALYYSSKRL